jgi:hypothetical protein
MNIPASPAIARDAALAPLERVRRLARWVRALAITGAVTLPLGTLWVWSSPERIDHFVAANLGVNAATLGLAPSTTWLGVLVNLLPVAAGWFALLQVWHLFGGYGRAEVFTLAAIRRLRRLAMGLLAVALAQVLARSATGVVLTLHLPPGERLLIVGFSSHDYVLLVFGLLLWAIAWVMVEAARLARENEQFV